MFGRPESNESAVEQKDTDIDQQQIKEEDPSEQQTEQQAGYQPTPNQLDAIISLAQSLTPLFTAISGWLAKKSKDGNDAKEEKREE
ncbi:hypothetical protein [Bacillus sp. JCM 19034]|uniref:hypothetical protein n=1 Tax=Bacillus sp. JCM 19034 TaxID=1481928 RepID=UPI0007839253|nr:hypothetical protein [Bacillus sp. JCM 19034]